MTDTLDKTGGQRVHEFFATRGWEPLAFQEKTWRAYAAGKSGLLQVPTGAGKTYAAVLGPLAQMIDEPAPGLKLLYLTPLRAVARDIEVAIKVAVSEIAAGLEPSQDTPFIRVESRTGDTKQSVKRKQLTNAPDILITTPESMSLMLSYKGSAKLFKHLRCVVVDEWHELISSKRGTQTELGLSRLRSLQPELKTWALSATIENTQEAAQAAVGLGVSPKIIKAKLKRKTVIESVLPEKVSTFPWAGHLGSAMVGPLLDVLEIKRSTLIFTNTRRQAERWYQLLSSALPKHAEKIALHHGSVERKVRESIEAGLKNGTTRWVVATSSLDLGVDFQPVERVVQIGSPKSVARLLQRAGRSQHAPGGTSEVLFVPTNILQLLEVNALRQAIKAGVVEAREPQSKPYDVLAQHLVTLACGDGFVPDEVFEEVRTTAAYQSLNRDEFDELMKLAEFGGSSLSAYPDFHRIEYKVGKDEVGRYHITSRKLAGRHRMSIGTITSNTAISLKFTNRRNIGSVDESFMAKLKPGDVFLFGGYSLEFVMMQDATAIVRKSKRPTTSTPSFGGASLPLSDLLGKYMLLEFERGQSSKNRPPEWDALRPVLETQARLSKLPSVSEILVERVNTREGKHLFLYPFEGRGVHEGLAALLALRMAKKLEGTFSFAVDEYGLEILAPKDYPLDDVFDVSLFNPENLAADLREGVNMSELARRQFRGVAQVAGLVFSGYPGSRKTGRQLQISTQTLYNVFREYEPNHPLLQQAEREVLEGLNEDELGTTLKRLSELPLTVTTPRRPTPLGFPLVVTRLRSKLSNETLMTRVERMVKQWMKA